MARRRNPARLVIALSVAAVLAVFLLYTSLAGGTPVPPAERARRAHRRGRPGRRRSSAGDGRRARRRPALHAARRRRERGPCRSSTRARCPISSRRAATSMSRARSERHLRRETDSLVTKCPSKYADQANYLMPEPRPRRPRRRPRARRLRGSRRRLRRLPRAPAAARVGANALYAAFATRRDRRRSSSSPRSPAATSRFVVRRRAHEPRAAARLHALRLLERAGGIAAPLAARPHGHGLGRGRAEPEAHPRGAPVDGPDPRRRSRASSPCCSSFVATPVRDPGAPRRRRRAQPEPPEPVHARAPAAALPRLRRADDPVRRSRWRALASRRADERWIVATRRWTLAAWTFLGFAILLGREVGLRGGRAGAAGTPGTRSRTPRSCPGSSRPRSSTR